MGSTAEFIGVAIEGVLGLLERHTGAVLAGLNPPRAPFTHFGIAFRGQTLNPPELWVEPVTTILNPEGSFQNETHELRVKLAVTAGDPTALTYAVLAYVMAVSRAIGDYEFDELGGAIKRVYVSEHNYGPLRTMGTGFGAFPEIYLTVEMAEL